MPPKPGRLGMPTLEGDVTIMALKYKVTLPAPGAGDVATRKLSITAGDNPTTTVDLPGNATSHEFTIGRDVAVSLQLVDVDSSGNASPPSPVLAFTSKDTIPPPAPGELAAELVGQED